MEEILFHKMIEKLDSGEWKKATTKSWQENYGQYVTLIRRDDRMILLLHENHDRVVGWTLNMADSLNIKFVELGV